MNFIRMIKAELIMLRGEIKNYYLNYIFYNIGIIVIFLGIIYNINEKSSVIVLIGLVLWQMSSSGLNYIAYVVQDEAMMGTLEQIELTKTSIQKVMLSKIIVNYLFVFVKAAILLIVTLALSFYKLDFNGMSFKVVLVAILITMLCTISFYFIGELFGGLALYFKRIGSIVGVIGNFLLLFSGIINEISYDNFLYFFTPISSGLKIIECLSTNSINVVLLNHCIYFLIINVIYIFIGLFTFKYMLKASKKSGNLGQY